MSYVVNPTRISTWANARSVFTWPTPVENRAAWNFAQPAAVALKWRDGLCVYIKNYAHKEDALSDLGVSEDTLEPIEP
jgi:hypothetical protein